MESPYGPKRPEIGGGGGGGASAPKGFRSPGQGRLAPALRWGNDVVAGKPGGAHSDLLPFAQGKGKPDEMGFARKDTGSTDIGPHKGYFFNRTQASQILRKNPDISTDPEAVKQEKGPWQAQSYDMAPESGKKSSKRKK